VGGFAFSQQLLMWFLFLLREGLQLREQFVWSFVCIWYLDAENLAACWFHLESGKPGNRCDQRVVHFRMMNVVIVVADRAKRTAANCLIEKGLVVYHSWGKYGVLLTYLLIHEWENFALSNATACFTWSDVWLAARWARVCVCVRERLITMFTAIGLHLPYCFVCWCPAIQ